MWSTSEIIMNKTPSYEDYRNHTGLHYHRLWKATGDDWSCPGCGRNKFQIMRWTIRFPNTQDAFMDWVAALHKHHDHSVDYMSLGVPRFPETLICDQCNSADGTVKRMLKLPKNFSFSPQEMRVFIEATPHGKHKIDYERALNLFTILMNSNVRGSRLFFKI